jgi:MFS family permease
VLAAATFATSLGLGMLVPAFPLLTAGQPQTVLGLLVSAFGTARLLVSLPAGLAIDRLGLRPVAAAGTVILFAGSALGAAGLGFFGLLAAIALQGAGSAVFATAAMSAMALAAGPAGRARAMSWFQGALLLAFALGPVAGGTVVARFGPLSPFLVQAALCLPALALLPAFATGRGPGRAAGAAGSVLSRGLVGGSSMAFAGFFVRAVISWVLAPVLAVTLLDLSPDRLGLIVGAATLVNLAVLPLNARLIARRGAAVALAAGLAATIGGLLVLPVSLSEPALWLALVLILSGTGAMMPAASVLALDGVHPGRIGRAMGLFRTVGDVGMALGPTAVTALAGLIGGGYRIGFFVTLAAVALCFALFAASRLAPAR